MVRSAFNASGRRISRSFLGLGMDLCKSIRLRSMQSPEVSVKKGNKLDNAQAWDSSGKGGIREAQCKSCCFVHAFQRHHLIFVDDYSSHNDFDHLPCDWPDSVLIARGPSAQFALSSGMPAYSSRPRAKLMFCKHCVAAPLSRLSSMPWLMR